MECRNYLGHSLKIVFVTVADTLRFYTIRVLLLLNNKSSSLYDVSRGNFKRDIISNRLDSFCVVCSREKLR